MIKKLKAQQHDLHKKEVCNNVLFLWFHKTIFYQCLIFIDDDFQQTLNKKKRIYASKILISNKFRFFSSFRKCFSSSWHEVPVKCHKLPHNKLHLKALCFDWKKHSHPPSCIYPFSIFEFNMNISSFSTSIKRSLSLFHYADVYLTLIINMMMIIKWSIK